MPDKQDHSKQHLNENYKPDATKNYKPATTLPNQQQPGHGVDGNYVPTTDTAPSSPPPKPKK